MEKEANTNSAQDNTQERAPRTDPEHNEYVKTVLEDKTREIKNERGLRFKRNPLYIGIFIKKNDKQKVTDLAKDVIKQVAEGFNSYYIQSDLKAIDDEENNTWQTPPSPHITTLFVGRKTLDNEDEQKILTGFKDGLTYPYTVHGILYQPGKIVTGVTFIDREKVDVANEFDHMTMYFGKEKPVYSNDILAATFGEGGPGQEDYQNKFEGLEGVKEYKVTVGDDEPTSVYLVIPKRLTLFYGKTRIIL